VFWRRVAGSVSVGPAAVVRRYRRRAHRDSHRHVLSGAVRPDPPSAWGPPHGGKHTALWAGNRGDPHAQRADRGLMLITVARVLDAASELLGECA
jgi:hypothetical protein